LDKNLELDKTKPQHSFAQSWQFQKQLQNCAFFHQKIAQKYGDFKQADSRVSPWAAAPWGISPALG
jgi:hypothetical protein